MNNKKIKLAIVLIAIGFIFLTPPAFADSVGRSEIFNVSDNYDQENREQVEATLHYASKWGYFYIENQWWNNISLSKKTEIEKIITDLGNEFDEIIYPKITGSFGSVWNPGIDDDVHITILMTNLKQNTGGYFSSCNEYSSSRCKKSNMREMIHINLDYIFDSRLKGFIAHEFQHVITWNQKSRLADKEEDVWLNELRSEYVPTFLGYDKPYSESILKTRVSNFLNHPSDPLGEWKGETADYGAITLFGHYLADQFGQNLFSLMLKNKVIGIESINSALNQAGYSLNFNQIFTNWSLANYFNSLSMGQGSKYGYTNSELKKIHISPVEVDLNSYGFVNFSAQVKDWSPRWYLINNKLPYSKKSIALELEFNSSTKSSNFKIPYVINYINGRQELGFIGLEQQLGSAYIFDFAEKVESVLLVPANYSKTKNFTNNDLLSSFSLKASTIVINQPIITSISPLSGPVSGGNTVLINGGNFQKGTEVHFGEKEVSQVEFINETSLSVVVPSHKAGKVNVWIKNPDEQSSVFASGYEYNSPPISDGALIRAKGDYKVYIIKGNYKRHILDDKIFDFYGHLNWTNIIEVTQEERDSYINSPWIRAANYEEVYEVNEDKTKHWLNMSAQNFKESGRRWDGVFIINKQERDFYKIGADVLYNN